MLTPVNRAGGLPANGLQGISRLRRNREGDGGIKVTPTGFRDCLPYEPFPDSPGGGNIQHGSNGG
jgi:hypothetical protein